MPSRDGKALCCFPAFFALDHQLEEFRKVSTQATFVPGSGLPLAVLETRRTLRLPDVTQEAHFPLDKAARQSGLKAGVGVPILAGDEVIAVLAFFLREPCPEDERFVDVIVAVAAQIGLVIERKRAEEALRK